MWAALVDLLRGALDLFFAVTGNYGLAIILLTVAVRLVLLPLTFSQVRSMRKMQALQPELQRLQRKYRDDPQRLNEETLKLWRQHGVSPLSGCLPVLLQLPILWAFFQALNTFQFKAPAGFLWIQNLAGPDPYHVLPILAGATTLWQSLTALPQSAGDPSQRMLTYVFPFMVAWFSWRFPSGLSLYWVTSNLFSVAQQWLINRQDAAGRPEPAAGEGAGGEARPAGGVRGKKARKGEA